MHYVEVHFQITESVLTTRFTVPKRKRLCTSIICIATVREFLTISRRRRLYPPRTGRRFAGKPVLSQFCRVSTYPDTNVRCWPAALLVIAINTRCGAAPPRMMRTCTTLRLICTSFCATPLRIFLRRCRSLPTILRLLKLQIPIRSY